VVTRTGGGPDFDAVAEAISPAQFANALGARKAGGSTSSYRCPLTDAHANGDRSPSLSIFRDGGRTAAKCHACGLAGSPVSVGATVWGISMPDAARRLADAIGLYVPDPNGDGRGPPGLTLERFAAGKRLDLDLLRSCGLRTRSEGRAAVEIPYLDADGAELRVRLRWALAAGEGSTWAPGDGLYLYGLDRLAKAKPGRPVFVVEGETDCFACWSHDVLALGVPGATAWRSEWAALLERRTVHVWEEPDAAGTRFARSVARDISDARIIRPSEDRPKDLHELHVQVEGDREAFRSAVAELARGAVPGADVLSEPDPGPAESDRVLPAPIGVGDLLDLEEPDEEWLVEGILPLGGNVLIAGYPKTYKTMVLLELGVALASGTPFLGRFTVPERRRAGIVLMEDVAHRAKRRLVRLGQARGIELGRLDGWLYLWSRPPLRLDDETVEELGQYAGELDLDLLAVDSWSYVAGGDSNSADEVTPQLLALSRCREQRPGLTVELTHHARKDPGLGVGQRLTDTIRNSSAFGAWYDAGLLLGRKDERSPVTVRTELRDYTAPEPFSFVVEDEEPAGEGNARSTGWLRLRVSGHRPEVLERIEAARRLVPAVREFLREHPDGVSRTKLRGGITGTNTDIEAAFEVLVDQGEAEHTPSPGPGQAAVYRLRNGHPAEPCRDPAAAGSERDPADPAAPPVGGRPGQGSEAERQSDPAPATPQDFETDLEQAIGVAP